MADVFISYKREDRDRVQMIARTLQEEGFSVWWDPEISLGASYAAAIRAELEAASTVLAVWSNQSVHSEWVQEEATLGKKRGLLVPCCIDNVEPPIGFTMSQAANLVGWRGQREFGEWRKLVAHVASNAKREALAHYSSTPRPRVRRPFKLKPWMMIAGAALALMAVAGVIFGPGLYDSWRADPPAVRFVGHGGASAAAFSSDGAQVFVSDDRGSVGTFHAIDGVPINTIDALDERITRLALFEEQFDGARLAVGGSAGSIAILSENGVMARTSSAALARELNKPAPPPSAIVSIVAGWNGVRWFDRNGGFGQCSIDREKQTCRPEEAVVGTINWNGDAMQIADIFPFTNATDMLVGSRPEPLFVSSDTRYVEGCGDCETIGYSVRQYNEWPRELNFDTNLTAVAYVLHYGRQMVAEAAAADGSPTPPPREEWTPALVLGGEGGLIEIIDTRKMYRSEELSQAGRRLHGHAGAILALAVSPNYRVLASASADRTIRFWDVASGGQLGMLRTGSESPFLAFSPDGQFLLARGSGGAAGLWPTPDAAHGQATRPEETPATAEPAAEAPAAEAAVTP